MSVLRIIFLIHAFIMGRVENFISLVSTRFYHDRHNLRLIFLNDNTALSPERNRFANSIAANKYNYKLQAGH